MKILGLFSRLLDNRLASWTSVQTTTQESVSKSRDVLHFDS